MEHELDEYEFMHLLASSLVPVEKFKQAYYILFDKPVPDIAEVQYNELLEKAENEESIDDEDRSYC